MRYQQLDDFVHSEQFKASESPSQALSGQVSRLFPHAFEQTTLRRRSTTDLDWLFRAANVASEYGVARGTQWMAVVHDELRHRKADSEFHRFYLYRAHVIDRSWDEARALAEGLRDDELEPIRPPRDLVPANFSGPTAIAVDPQDVSLRRVPVRFNGGRKIVIAFHPNCHFSRNAYDVLAADREASALLERDSLLVAPPQSLLPLRDQAAWNRDHPELPMVTAYSKQEWMPLTFSQTPVFYFMDDGKITGQLIGWPADRKASDFLDSARAAGFVP